ncbi:DUF7344 domain-containing protein [Halosolutus halophilus]|uniref:DUF7344 domain-containing protein n=1 Tax=Halosolutus halophilus TaxID=1552990 RepID=UPI0022352983|nr:hypothetical protein [Halosolutus halophilus]
MIAHSSDQNVRDDVVENGDVFDALSDDQRRQLLVDLLDSEPLRVSDLSDASRELIEAHEALLDQFLSGQLEIPGVDRELIQKRRVHLPKLAEYGFVEWHPEDRLVTRGPRFDELKPSLELMEDQRTDCPATEPFVSFRG